MSKDRHISALLTPYTLIKFCCVLTYPPYINLIFDIVIAHNGDGPPKDQRSWFIVSLDETNFKLRFTLVSTIK